MFLNTQDLRRGNSCRKWHDTKEIDSSWLLFPFARRGTPHMTNDVSSSPGRKLVQSERIVVGLVILVIPLVFGTAIWLTPNPAGYGTHQQLGLPDCAILSLTGSVCPHCGLTTSFAWFSRGEWAASWNANPAGWMLACSLLMMWPWLILVIIQGFWLGVQEPGRWCIRGFAGWLIASFLQWIFRFL